MPPATGREEILVERRPVTTAISSLPSMSIRVTTPKQAVMFNAALMSDIEISCKLAKHTFRHSRYKLEAEVRFCWNVTHPPSEITSHDRYRAVGTAQRPSFVVGSPSHKKWNGGAGYDYVDTKAKGKFCTPSLQEDLTWLCEGYTRL